MQTCEAIGYPRPTATTPLEFLPELSRIFPESAADLQDITRAYLKVRYGEVPETQAEVDDIETAWKRVEVQAQAMLKQNPRRGGKSGVPRQGRVDPAGSPLYRVDVRTEERIRRP
jgi:hypothetical protein